MTDDDFYRRPHRSKREIAADMLSRLKFVNQEQRAPEPSTESPARKSIRESVRVRLYDGDFVQIAGAPYPVSKGLAHQLGYYVTHVNPMSRYGYSVGNDAEGEAG